MDRVYVMQLTRSFRLGELSRRQFLARATVALGSAAAAGMLLAACAPAVPGELPPIIESSGSREEGGSEPPVAAEGLSAGVVEYSDRDGETLMGYLARPAAAGPLPAVIVIQEWWGLNEHIQDVTRRFAGEGFVALAPDLYHGVVVSEPDEARKLVMELDMAEAVREIQQAIDFLQAQPYVAGPKVGVTGFCMGGRLVLMTAVADEDVGAAVPWYGSPLSPDEAAGIKAPLQGHYGSEDGGIPVASVRAMEDGLKAAGIESEIYVYEGAQHAFFNDTRASYNPEAAAQAWERTLSWLRAHL